MKGKVFSSSQDLYQDQAKILFDFYKDAAEKIVSQEEELEKKIQILLLPKDPNDDKNVFVERIR